MRALLVCPEFPLSFWSLQKTSWLTGCKALLPPLGLLTVAALCPWHGNCAWPTSIPERLTADDWQWADLILISAMYIQKEGRLAATREVRARGKTVVVGGPVPHFNA